jgi:hypothetical protein
VSSSSRPEVRLVVPPDERRRRAGGLWFAAAVSDALLVAVLLVGIAAGWPWWVVALAALVPLVVGLVAVRGALVLGRATRADSAGPPAR